MSRSETAKKREHEDMLSVLKKKGKCVRPDEDIYGWIDYQAERHIRDYAVDETGKTTLVESCAWVLDSEAVIEESHVTQFADTFSGNNEESAISVYPVACACGKYSDRTLRYVSDFGSIVRSLVEDF